MSGPSFFLSDQVSHLFDINRDFLSFAPHTKNVSNERFDPHTEFWARRNDACTRERHMLPGPSLLALINCKTIQCCRYGARPARGAQAQINIVEFSFVSWRRQRVDKLFRKARKIVLAAEAPLPIGL